VVGCADIQKASVLPFSQVLDGATSVLCFECYLCCTEGVASFSGISKHEPDEVAVC
jgi:hypothetical protein